MSTDAFQGGSPAAASATGALLLCGTEPESVALLAPLLRERMALTRAGEHWSVLVPEGGPWRAGVPEGGPRRAGGAGPEPVDRVCTGWASALAVGSSWPVVALWWDADGAGYTLATGFRRPVGYVWLADGTPAGEEEAMRTFAARLGLDPVLDAQRLDGLTAPDSGADGRARLRGLVAVLTRAGVRLPSGLTPGEDAERLLETAARAPDGVRWITGADPRETDRTEAGVGESGPAGAPGVDADRRGTVRAEADGGEDARPLGPRGVERDRRETAGTEAGVGEGGPLAPWLPGSGDPRARMLALAQIAVGLPVTAWGAWRRSGGWVTTGLLLLAHGALGVSYTTLGAPYRGAGVPYRGDRCRD